MKLTCSQLLAETIIGCSIEGTSLPFHDMNAMYAEGITKPVFCLLVIKEKPIALFKVGEYLKWNAAELMCNLEGETFDELVTEAEYEYENFDQDDEDESEHEDCEAWATAEKEKLGQEIFILDDHEIQWWEIDFTVK